MEGPEAMNRSMAAIGMALLAGAPALAQETRHTIDLGVYYNYLGGVEVNDFDGAGVPPRASLEASNVTALWLSYEFQATPNLGLQLSTGIGGSFTMDGAYSLAALGSLFKADQFSASAFLNYHFFEPTNALRPLLGLGVTYTAFSNFRSYTGQSVDMSSDWSLAVQAGARYAFDRHWSIVGTLGATWPSSAIRLSDGTGTQTANVEFRPMVLTLGVGYSF
jgi:outer membrane protein